MAEEGIHPEVMRNLVELHKKHSDLQLQMHDAKGAGGDQNALQGAVQDHQKALEKHGGQLEALTTAVNELISVMKQDVEADKAVAATMGRRGTK